MTLWPFLITVLGAAMGYGAGIWLAPRVGKLGGAVNRVTLALAAGFIAYAGFALVTPGPQPPAAPIMWADSITRIGGPEEYQRFLEDTKGEAALVDVYAAWCAGCRGDAPQVNALAGAGRRVAVINAAAARDLAESLGVSATPVYFIVMDGRPVKRLEGPQSLERLRAALEAAEGE